MKATRSGGGRSDTIGTKTDRNTVKTEVPIPLGIPEVRVLKTDSGERGEIIITLESSKNGTACRKCGKWITKLPGRDEGVMVRH